MMAMLPPRTKTVTIPANETESEVLDLDLYTIAALEFGDDWTGESVTLKAATAKDGTYRDVYTDAGSVVTIKAGEDRVVVVDIAVIATAALKYLKLVAGSSTSTERTVNVIMKR